MLQCFARKNEIQNNKKLYFICSNTAQNDQFLTFEPVADDFNAPVSIFFGELLCRSPGTIELLDARGRKLDPKGQRDRVNRLGLAEH